MDEMLQMVSSFADAMRSLATLPKNIADGMNSWLASLSGRASPLGTANNPTDPTSRASPIGTANNPTDPTSRASPIGTANNPTDPTSASGATQGQVNRALSGLQAQLNRLPAFLGTAAADMQPELDRLSQLFAALQNSSNHLAKGGFAELSSALKKLENIKYSGDVSKIGDLLSTSLEKAYRAAAVAADKAMKGEAGQAKREREETGKSPLGPLILALGDFSAALRKMQISTENFNGALGKTVAPLLAGAQAVTHFYEGLARSASQNLQGFSGAAGAVGGLTGGVMGPLQQLAGVVGPFVQALNPGLMKIFNQALRDLTATFGVAFAPIIQHVSALFNSLSATLAPAMHALAPIIDNLMSVLEGTLVPIIGMIADAFVALSPIIEFVTSIMASLAEAMRVVYTVFRSAIQVLFDVIKQMFGGVDLKGAAQGIQDVIRQLTKYFVQFAAYVAKALGYLDPFAKALEKNLDELKGQKPGQKAAPENVHIAGLDQISKDLAVAAYSAQVGAGGRKKSEAEFLEEIIDLVKAMKGGKTLDQMIEQLKEDLVKGFLDDLVKIWDRFVQYMTNDNPIAREIRDAANMGEAGRRMQEQADELRRRGVPVAADLGGGFWANLGDVLRGR